MDDLEDCMLEAEGNSNIQIPLQFDQVVDIVVNEGRIKAEEQVTK